MDVAATRVTLNRSTYDAVIFDLDGVITRTATTHAKAWKAMFDEFLAKYATRSGREFIPFDIDADYLRYVDGKPRYDGVQSFLSARGIALPYGTPRDSADQETVCGLGNRKNAMFLQLVKEQGVDVYPSTIEVIRCLREKEFKTAVVSSSKNTTTILEVVGLQDLFDTQVDGLEAARLKLRGKPAPDTFLEACERLGVKPARAVVVEDALSGVAAGRRGGFGCTIGVARNGDLSALYEAGADQVVTDLNQVRVAD